MATYYDLKPSYKDSNGDIHTIPTYAVDTVLNTESTNAISNGAVATALQGLQTATGNPVTITNAAPINAQSVRVAIEAVQEGSGTPSPDNVRPIVGWDALRLNVSGEDTSDPTTYTKSLSTTNYGGYWDATEGVIGTEYGFVTLDSTNSWLRYGESRFYCDIIGVNEAALSTTGYISNMYEFEGDGNSSSSQVTVDNKFYGQRRYGRFWVYDSRFITLEEWKSFLADHPLQIGYPLATPTTSSTTPEEIPLSQGINNLWSDTGDVTIKHWPNNIIGQLVGLIQQSQS